MATLDGLTITGGQAKGVSVNATDRGGGMYNRSASPIVTNCSFANNSAEFGGGMHNISYLSPTVTNCTFANNHGGAIYNGCAAMYCGNISEPLVTNCILWGNTAGTSLREIDDPIIVPENGGSWDPAAPDYYTSTKVSHSIAQGGLHSGENIITSEPRLVDAANGHEIRKFDSE